jgi:pimeloyl-ACP methyl ester carboxylesterase
MSKLHVQEWTGPGATRTAVLLHMLTQSSNTWWRVGPELAERGYRVLAPDLPGHGHSPRAATYSIDAMVEALVASVPAGPDLVVAHSFGAIVLARCVDVIAPARVVYAEPAWVPVGDRSRFEFYQSQKRWTIDDVRAESPKWPAEAHAAKLESLRLWDAETLQAIDGFPGLEPAAPRVPSLIVTADPSRIIPAERVERLRAQGYTVRVQADSAHVLHNEDFDGFMKSLADWV